MYVLLFLIIFVKIAFEQHTFFGQSEKKEKNETVRPEPPKENIVARINGNFHLLYFRALWNLVLVRFHLQIFYYFRQWQPCSDFRRLILDLHQAEKNALLIRANMNGGRKKRRLTFIRSTCGAEN